jgi:hypothetical protein
MVNQKSNGSNGNGTKVSVKIGKSLNEKVEQIAEEEQVSV